MIDLCCCNLEKCVLTHFIYEHWAHLLCVIIIITFFLLALTSQPETL
jgi:hypothetical protein